MVGHNSRYVAHIYRLKTLTSTSGTILSIIGNGTIYRLSCFHVVYRLYIERRVEHHPPFLMYYRRIYLYVHHFIVPPGFFVPDPFVFIQFASVDYNNLISSW